MTDSYIASLPLVSVPGSVQAYSNCGYYLLGRVVAKLRGTADPISAYHNLLEPLGITRIRAAVDRLAGQPADEARYQAASFGADPLWLSDLMVNQSQQTPDQPVVAVGYGDDELAIAQGASGLSGAATDAARLVAILLDTSDYAALKRVTLEQVLSEGAVLGTARTRSATRSAGRFRPGLGPVGRPGRLLRAEGRADRGRGQRVPPRRGVGLRRVVRQHRRPPERPHLSRLAPQ
jgi:CubicO group peptidase (beta-lactamase class C family)